MLSTSWIFKNSSVSSLDGQVRWRLPCTVMECLKHMASSHLSEARAFTTRTPLSGGGAVCKSWYTSKQDLNWQLFACPLPHRSDCCLLRWHWQTVCGREDKERGKRKGALLPVSLYVHIGSYPLQTSNDSLLIHHCVLRVSFLLEMWLWKIVKFCWTNPLPVCIQSHLLTTVMKH